MGAACADYVRFLVTRSWLRRSAEAVTGRTRIYLFGSRARGEGDEESDLDLFVALHQDDPGREVEATALRLACDLTLKHGVLVSALVADRAFLTSHEGYSLLETIEEDGIRL